MRLIYVWQGSLMTLREISRNRFALTLLVTIPALFFTLVWLTTGDDPIAFRLASVSEETFVEVNGRDQSLVFIGVAVVGLLASFLAMNIVQKSADVNRRLVVCGYHPAELILAKLLVMICLVSAISLYVSVMMSLFFPPRYLGFVVVGFGLAGIVHACYGLLVGAVVRRELEGMLLIVLLVNIDAGWLQNPVFYADAHNKELIRYLPAYFPSQASAVASFTDYSLAGPFFGSVFYSAVLLAAALAFYLWRMKIIRPTG